MTSICIFCSIHHWKCPHVQTQLNILRENGLTSSWIFGRNNLHCFRQHLLRLQRRFFLPSNPRLAIIHVPLALIRLWFLGAQDYFFFYSHCLSQNLNVCLSHWREIKWYKRNHSAHGCCHHHTHSHYWMEGTESQPRISLVASWAVTNYSSFHSFLKFTYTCKTQAVFVTIYTFNYQ